MAGLPQKPIILSKNGIFLILGDHEKNVSKKISEKSIFSTFGDAVFQNLHFEYASYGIKRCAEQFPTHNTMFLSYWGVKICVRKLFASTFHRQCLGVFSEFFGDFLTTFTPPRYFSLHIFTTWNFRINYRYEKTQRTFKMCIGKPWIYTSTQHTSGVFSEFFGGSLATFPLLMALFDPLNCYHLIFQSNFCIWKNSQNISLQSIN